MAIGYSHSGLIVEWDYCHTSPDIDGTPLALSASAYTLVTTGDEGKAWPSNYFTDTDVNLKGYISYYYWRPPPDVAPNYTGAAGVRRTWALAVKAYDAETLIATYVGPVDSGAGVPAGWYNHQAPIDLAAFNVAFTTGDRPRFVPAYSDNGISGPRIILSSIRVGWMRVA